MTRYFFSAKQKLKKEKDFASIFKKGKRFETDFFKAYYKENRLSYSRLGVSVSKRVGNAVSRNRIKRVVREWFRLNCSRFKRSFDVIFAFNKTISRYTNKNLTKSLDRMAVVSMLDD